MLKSSEHEIRAIQIKKRLREIESISDLTDEIRSESDGLQVELRDVETRRAAALASEGDPNETREVTIDSAERKTRAIGARSKLTRYTAAAITGQPVDGAEAEYAEARGCPGYMPLDMTGPTMEQRQAAFHRAVEHRAVTPAPADTDVPSTHAPIVPAIFDRAAGAYLGVEMPTVATGIASYPVLSTSLQGGMVAESGEATEGAGAFTVKDADPRRLTGAFRIRKEDVAKLPNLEESLRENLSRVLSDEYDKQLVTGDNVAPNLDGILRQLTDPSAPAASAETFDRYLAALTSHIDGLMSVDEMGVRALVGPHTYRHMAASLRAGNAADQTFTQYWRSNGGGIRASRRIADPATMIQQAIIRRSNPAGDRVAVAPVWMGMEILRDPYTAAGKGELVLTGTVLIGGVVILRDDAFVQDSFRLA